MNDPPLKSLHVENLATFKVVSGVTQIHYRFSQTYLTQTVNSIACEDDNRNWSV